MTEFWPIEWEQKWYMLFLGLAYKNFIHGSPFPLFSHLLTECCGSRWSWGSYVKNIKALINQTSLVIAWSKASPPFIQTPIQLWARNIYCSKPLRFFSLSVNTGSICFITNMMFRLYSCPFSKPGSVNFLVILWASEYPFLFVTQNWFSYLQLKSRLIHYL